jgi:hypothetical protein
MQDQITSNPSQPIVTWRSVSMYARGHIRTFPQLHGKVKFVNHKTNKMIAALRNGAYTQNRQFLAFLNMMQKTKHSSNL